MYKHNSEDVANLYKAMNELEQTLSSYVDAGELHPSVIVPLTSQLNQIIGALNGALIVV
jgi:hypothetical protein